MIARLCGVVVDIESGSAVVDVQGVGYRVFLPGGLLASLQVGGDPVTLHTEMVVREDGSTLFGFADTDERRLFCTLLSVTGVGPRLALAILTTYDGGELPGLISQNDTKSLARTPGVGPRLAQRICLELGEKMAEFAFNRRISSAAKSPGGATSSALTDVVEALVVLGYSRMDARRAADRAAEALPSATVDELLRSSLNLLSAGRA